MTAPGLDSDGLPAQGDRRWADSGEAGELRSAGLSEAQRRLWFLETCLPTGAAYTIGSVFKVHGCIDTARLRHAIMVTLRLHPGLRQVFSPGEDGPEVELLNVEEVPDPLNVESWEVSAPADVDEWARQRVSRPFESMAKPLYRFDLLLITPDSSVISIVLHHLVADGWSLNLLYACLQQGYEGCSPDNMKAVALHKLAPSAMHAKLSYWRRTLDGASNLQMPLDRPRPPTQTFSGARQTLLLGPDILERLDALALQLRTTLFTLLATACGALLAQWAGQDDIVVGTPVADRASVAAEEAVGLLVNTVVLRLKIDISASFRDMVRDVRGIVLGALANSDVPFDLVVAQANPSRSLNINPLFQVVFALQSATEPLTSFAGFKVTQLDPDPGTSRFDLEWTLFRRPEGLLVRVTRNTDLFESRTVVRLLQAFQTILLGALSAPDEPPEGILCLPDRPAADALVPLAHSTLHGMFEAQAAGTPGAPALHAGETILDYATLACMARAVSVCIPRGDGKQLIVGLCVRRSADMVAGLLGIIRGGAAVLPLDPDDPPARRAMLLDDAGATFVVTDRATMSLVADRDHIVLDDIFLDSEPSPSPAAEPLAGDALAYVIYTSGTSGSPKGVAVEHRNVLNTMLACRTEFELGMGRTTAVLAAFTFDIFFFELMSALLFGGTARLVSRQTLLDPAMIVPVLQEVTCLQAVPGLMRQLLAAITASNTPRLLRMRDVTTGGDVVPPDLLVAIRDTFPNARVSVTYGPTETAILASKFEVSQPESIVGHPIGGPLSGVTLELRTVHGKAVVADAMGEIWIGGRGVSRGYLNRPELQRDRFVEIGGQRFFRTGDFGRRLDNGIIEYLGREDQQVKIRGFRVELGEIEHALCGLPGIQEAVCAAPLDAAGDRRLVAGVVLEESYCDDLDRRVAAQRTKDWKKLFDQAHTTPVSSGFDFTGWNDSVTGQPIPRHEMEQHLADSIEQINRAVIRSGRTSSGLRILEVGGGTGNIMRRLAPGSRCYDVCEPSPVLVRRLQQVASELGLDQVRAIQAEADNLPANLDAYELIVLNSVIQYFPSGKYLRKVVSNLLTRLTINGVLFLGDIRNLATLPLFRDGALSSAGSAEEDELLVHPSFFSAFLHGGGVSTIECWPKEFRASNELSAYRYACVLWRGLEPARAGCPEWRDWRADGWSIPRLSAAMSRIQEPISISAIPNGHIAGSDDTPTPSVLAELARVNRLGASFSCASGRSDGSFDAVVAPSSHAPSWVWPAAASAVNLVNDPISAERDLEIEREIRPKLRAILPTHLIPSDIFVIERLPLTANDKVDRAALSGRRRRSGPGAALPSSPLEQAIAKCWAAVLGIEKVATDENFFDVGGTSLLAIRLSIRLRAAGLHVGPQDLFRHQTVADLALALASSNQAHGPLTPAAAVGSPHAQYYVRSVEDEFAGQGHVVLAGATGFLGVHLLETLLRQTERSVICLVRGADDPAAAERLNQNAKWYFPELASPEVQRRILTVACDVSNLATMQAALPRMLDGGTAPIVNAAADVRHVAHREAVFQTNLLGAEALLDIAGRCGGVLHQVSTVGVKGVAPAGERPRPLLETDLPGRLFTEAYSESKAQAELSIRAALLEGARAAIYRVGTIAPHSVTGRFQRNAADHFFSRYVRSMVLSGVAGQWDFVQFRLTPVDVMAEHVLALARTGCATYHLETPVTTRHRDVVDALRDYGYEIEIIDDEKMAAMAFAPGTSDSWTEAVAGFVPILLAQPGGRIEVDTKWTAGRLAAAGLHYPDYDASRLSRFVRHAVDCGFIPAPLSR